MGAIPRRNGTSFRVWAPHAEAVFVTGTFDEWAGDGTALERDGDGSSGTWSADVGSQETFDLDADGPPMDGCAQSGLISVGPDSVVILSREV